MEPIALAELWHWIVRFFTAPIPVFGLGLARMFIGLLVVIDGLRHLADAKVWLAPEALGLRELPRERGPALIRRLHALWWRPRVFVSVHCLLGFIFALGLGGGWVGALVFLTFRQIHRVNRYVLYGGDAVLRMAVLTLALSPCTASLSVDRWINAGDLGVWVEAPPWGMRLLQLELSVLYFYNCWYKVAHEAWRKGTAVYYPLQNTDIRNLRLPIPRFMLGRVVVAAGTWGTLMLECMLGPGLWIDELRLPLVIGAALLHLAIAYAFSLWLFSYIMLACLCVFIEPGWFTSADAVAVLAWGPTGTPIHQIAIVLMCAYTFFAVFWDPPHRSFMSRWIRQYFGPWLNRAGVVRRWRLFSGNPPANRTVTLVLTMTDREGQVSKWGWNQIIGLFNEDPLLEKRTVWNHRLRKYASSLLRIPAAQQRFGEYILKLARERGIEVQALTIDARFEYIEHMDRDEPSEPTSHRNLYTYVAPRDDERPLAALACSLADRSNSPLVVEILIYLAARATCEGRSDAEFLHQIKAFATTADWGLVPGAELDGTRAFVSTTVADPQRRQLYLEVLDALSGGLTWDAVLRSREFGVAA